MLKLMAKSPEDRYQSAALMLADLAKIRDTLHIGASVVSATATATSTSDENARSASPSTQSNPNRETAPRPSSVVSTTVGAVRLPVGKFLARLSPAVIVGDKRGLACWRERSLVGTLATQICRTSRLHPPRNCR